MVARDVRPERGITGIDPLLLTQNRRVEEGFLHPHYLTQPKATVSSMTDLPFQYDDLLLSSCARSDLAASLAPVAAIDQRGGDDAACYELFRQYGSHYGRDIDADSRSHDRFQRFVSNAVFVYRHNTNEEEDDGTAIDGPPRHRVTLNRFADRQEHELPLMVGGSADGFLPGDFDSLPLLSVGNVQGSSGQDSQLQRDSDSGPSFSRLEYSEDLLRSISATLGFGFFRRKTSHGLSKYTKQRSRYRQFKDEVSPLPGSMSTSGPVFIWSKKGQKSIYLERETDRKHMVRKDKIDETDATIDGQDYHGDSDFTRALDWSTANNPDGVPIVHAVMDQGTW